MTALTQAKAIVEALSDENVNNNKLKELMEFYNDNIAGGASDENEALEFLSGLGEHFSRAIIHAAEKAAKKDNQATVNAAKDAAKALIPNKIKKPKTK